jgi:hypothetical protein
MCDSFESMLMDLDKKDDVRHNIDTTYYWNFDKKTFRDFLNETNELDIWEYQTATFKTKASQHPNKKGYELISKELYNYIKGNKLL